MIAIFHELHPVPFYCSSEQWNGFVANVSGEAEMLTRELRQRKLVVDSPEDDQKEFELVAAKLEKKLSQPTVLYLMTAQGCNFSCKYCPIPEMAKRYGESMLSVDDAIAGIDLWREHLKSAYDPSLQYFIIFYGGEPLLNKETINASLAYVKELKDKGDLPPEVNVLISTNGALFDDETVALCKEHGVMVAIGIDGPKSANDTLRVDLDGFGTFDRIATTINLLVENDIRTFASVSITPHNIDQISEYSAFFEGLGIEQFGFNFLKGRQLLELVGKEGLEEYHLKASAGVIENSHRQKKGRSEYQMEKKLVAFNSEDFFPVDCTCYGNQLVIQPDGQISNCPFSKTWLGQVRDVGNDFRICDQAIVKEWRKRLPLYHPDFQDVAAKAICGGGCAWSSNELKGDPLAVDDSSRIFSEEVFNELIWSKLDRPKAS